jgi:hypothetical protein
MSTIEHEKAIQHDYAVKDDSGTSSVDMSDDKAPDASDSEMGRRVWRKLDLYLLPVVTMFYFLSFLVR